MEKVRLASLSGADTAQVLGGTINMLLGRAR
jgi:hypothetical protein